jgi:hypothetical protein
MRIGPLVISAVALAAPAGALDLRLSGFYDLNRPASLAAFDYVPTVQGGEPPDPGADCAIS